MKRVVSDIVVAVIFMVPLNKHDICKLLNSACLVRNESLINMNHRCWQSDFHGETRLALEFMMCLGRSLEMYLAVVRNLPRSHAEYPRVTAGLIATAGGRRGSCALRATLSANCCVQAALGMSWELLGFLKQHQMEPCIARFHKVRGAHEITVRACVCRCSKMQQVVSKVNSHTPPHPFAHNL